MPVKLQPEPDSFGDPKAIALCVMLMTNGQGLGV